MLTTEKMIPIRDEYIKCGGITEDGREGFFYNDT
jgi:hypothetical protein